MLRLPYECAWVITLYALDILMGEQSTYIKTYLAVVTLSFKISYCLNFRGHKLQRYLPVHGHHQRQNSCTGCSSSEVEAEADSVCASKFCIKNAEAMPALLIDSCASFIFQLYSYS